MCNGRTVARPQTSCFKPDSDPQENGPQRPDDLQDRFPALARKGLGLTRQNNTTESPMVGPRQAPRTSILSATCKYTGRISGRPMSSPASRFLLVAPPAEAPIRAVLPIEQRSGPGLVGANLTTCIRAFRELSFCRKQVFDSLC